MASFSPVICWEPLCNNTGQDLSGSELSHCHHPLLWWKMPSTIPFAAVLIYVANTPFAIPRSKLPLPAVLQALSFHFTSLCHGCLLLSRLFSWSAGLNRSFILQSSFTRFPILFSIPFQASLIHSHHPFPFIFYSAFLSCFCVFWTPLTFPYSFLCCLTEIKSAALVVAWQHQFESAKTVNTCACFVLIQLVTCSSLEYFHFVALSTLYYTTRYKFVLFLHYSDL